MKKVIIHTPDSEYSADKLRLSYLRHVREKPDCPHCKELGIDWATVEIEQDITGQLYPTWEVVED